MKRTAKCKMRSIAYLFLIAFVAVVVSCSESTTHYGKELDSAEKIMSSNADNFPPIFDPNFRIKQ